jgi:hypothetical protein
MRAWGVLAAALILAGCGGGGDNAGGLTAEENAELNNAAEMLDTAPETLPPLDQPTSVDGGEPSADGAAPTNGQ